MNYQAVIDKNLSDIENLSMLERLYMENQKRIMNYEKNINYKIFNPLKDRLWSFFILRKEYY